MKTEEYIGRQEQWQRLRFNHDGVQKLRHGSIHVKHSDLMVFWHAQMSCLSISKHVHILVMITDYKSGDLCLK